ncbi:hypothetical protein [Mesorhizobium sp. M1163]
MITLKKGAREQGALLIDEMLGLEVRDQAIRRNLYKPHHNGSAAN